MSRVLPEAPECDFFLFISSGIQIHPSLWPLKEPFILVKIPQPGDLKGLNRTGKRAWCAVTRGLYALLSRHQGLFIGPWAGSLLTPVTEPASQTLDLRSGSGSNKPCDLKQIPAPRTFFHVCKITCYSHLIPKLRFACKIIGNETTK